MTTILKPRKHKKLLAKEAIQIGQLLIARISKARNHFKQAELQFQKTIASLDAQQKALQEICPHPKKFYHYDAGEYMHEHCDLCGLDKWY